MHRDEKRWLVAGSYAIDADSILYINTSARFMGPAEGDGEFDAWGEVSPAHQVERKGVEVFWSWSRREDKPLRFLDGSPEAEDLRAFVEKSRPTSG